MAILQYTSQDIGKLQTDMIAVKSKVQAIDGVKGSYAYYKNLLSSESSLWLSFIGSQMELDLSYDESKGYALWLQKKYNASAQLTCIIELK